jgi:SNF2 family DNA or RNA helicase
MRKFQTLLKAVLLRRTKRSKIDGVEILEGLPGKTTRLVHAVFDQEQLEFYRSLETRAVAQMRGYEASGTLGRNYSNALTLLLRLRQACLHPRLAGSTGSVYVDERQVELARKFDHRTVSRVKSLSRFECPICFDAVENPTLCFPCGHHVAGRNGCRRVPMLPLFRVRVLAG